MWLAKFMLTILIILLVFLTSGFVAHWVFTLTYCVWTSSTVFSLGMIVLSTWAWLGGGDNWFT